MPTEPQGQKRPADVICNGVRVDPELVDCVFELSGERTREAAIMKALQEFVARRRQKRLLDLMGKLEWDTTFDYKAERTAVELPSALF